MTLIRVAAAVLAGALLAPIHRGAVFTLSVPHGQPPRGACPWCAATLRPARRRHGPRLLPATGRCPHCRQPIGPPTGLVEAATITILAVIAARIAQPLPLLAWSWLACCGLVLGFVDLTVHRLPDRLQALAAGGVGLLATHALTGHHPTVMLRMLACGLGVAAAYLVLVLTLGQGMGPGDAKLAAILATATATLSVAATITATLATFIIAGLTTALLAATRTVHHGQTIAFGPFILAGALTALLTA